MTSNPNSNDAAGTASNAATNTAANTASNTVYNIASPSLADRVKKLATGRNAIATGIGGAGSAGPRDGSSLLAPNDSPRRRHITESDFREYWILQLNRSRRTAERSKSAKDVSQEILFYPVDTLMEIWAVAKDLSEIDAPLEARIAGFVLLSASASHSGLGPAERMEMYNSIVVAIDGTCVAMQFEALNGLTNNGDNLDPFETLLVPFLNTTLKSQFEFVSRKRSEPSNIPEHRSRDLLEGAEDGLNAILIFYREVITKNRDAIRGDNLVITVSRVLLVAQRTTAERDMKGAIAILAAILKFSPFPESHLKSCIEVLCAVTCTVSDLAELSWESLLGLLISPSRQGKTLEILLGILFNCPQDKQSNTTRGALRSVTFLFLNDGAKGLPKLSFTQLVTGLWEVHFVSSSLQRDCLKDIGSILKAADLVRPIVQRDWDTLIAILVTLTGSDEYVKDMDDPANRRATLFSRSPQAISVHEAEDKPKLREDIVRELQSIADTLVVLWPELNPEKRLGVKKFFEEFRTHLTLSASELFIQQMVEDNSSIPGTNGWEKAQENLVYWYLLDERQHPSIRCLVLQILEDSLSYISTPDDRMHYRKFFSDIMARLEGEKCLQTVNGFAALIARYSHIAETEEVESFVRALTSMSALEATDSPSSTETRVELVLNTVTISLVSLFLHCLPTSARKAVIVYNALVDIATDLAKPTNARLAAMKLLTRLRCDSTYAIMVINVPDSLGLAATLCRTEESALPSTLYYLLGDHSSTTDEQQPMRVGRASMMNPLGSTASRTSTRSASGQKKSARPTPPLWMYPGGKGLPDDPPSEPSQVLYVATPGSDPKTTLKINDWLETTIGILQQASDWEIYSYILVHSPSQLSNSFLFTNAVPHIRLLRSVVVSQLKQDGFHIPPASTGVKRGDVALCLYHALIMLLGYNEHFAKDEQDNIVRAVLHGIGTWDRVAKMCIHSLAICCHEIPASITRFLNDILKKMAKIITQSNLAMDVLEFLGGLAGLPEVYANLTETELRLVFTICIRYLEHSREQRLKLLGGSNVGATYASNRHSGVSGEVRAASESSKSSDANKDLPQYVFALAYHVMTLWFLSLRLVDRSKHVGWISRSLAWKDQKGNEIMEEQSQVTLDMMHRTAYSDLGETAPNTDFKPSDGKILRKSWLLGLSIVTVETAVGTGLTQLIKRQASGTTYAMYQQHSAPLHPHHVPAPADILSSAYGPESRINVFPNHILLQIASTIAPAPAPMEPICLPDDEIIRRAISAFDRNDTVDGHKIGVIYIGNNQTLEGDILANTKGSKAYERLLAGLGTKVQLKGASFNTQGLDRESDIDGTHTYAWRDRVTEIIYHVTTMMPTDLEHDGQGVKKKRHIGNDFVNIIFNESGLEFQFDTFASEFNYVNIVITPDALLVPYSNSYANKSATAHGDGPIEGAGIYHERQQFFKVQTLSHPSFPSISPTASYKLISASALPGLVRQLALNASVFSLVWSSRDGGEHVSSWRNRLREIVRLRERYANTGTSTSAKYPGAKGEKTYVEGDRWTGVVAMGGLAEEEGVLSGLDFSRWAGQNPSIF